MKEILSHLNTTYKFSANKKNYENDTYEDYKKYINEYIILSFEYAEEK